jgi:hypothetical protein
VVLGCKASFKKDLRLPPSGTGRAVVTRLGVVSYIAEGIALLLVGLLFIIATVNARLRSPARCPTAAPLRRQPSRG